MNNCWRLLWPILALLLCWVATAQAETRYVSDQLVVSLREAPQGGATVITYLRSDAAVEMLEDLGEFAKVRSAAGEVGYIQQQYLVADIPKITVIERLQKERDRLAARVKEMEQQASMSTTELEKDRQKLAGQLREANEQTAGLMQELETARTGLDKVTQDYLALQESAKDVVAVTAERDQLRATNQQLAATAVRFEEERDTLQQSGAIKWFLAGSGVLLLGWAIGKFSRSRRRSSF